MYFFCLHWSLFIAVISYGNEWNKRVCLSESLSQSDWIKANSTGVSCQSQSHSNKHIQLSNSHKKISPNPSTASSFPILFFYCVYIPVTVKFKVNQLKLFIKHLSCRRICAYTLFYCYLIYCVSVLTKHVSKCWQHGIKM